jgi:O-Antigen ligase
MWSDRHPGTTTLAPWAALLAGIVVTFPGTMPGVGDGSGPRTTDLLNLVCTGLLAFAVFRSAKLHRAIYGVVLVWALTVPWIFMEIHALAGVPDPAVQRLLIRWILCGCSAYFIAVLADTPVLRPRFLCGLLIGIALSSLTLLYDFLTFSPEDLPIEQLVNLAIYNGKDIYDFIYRSYGIFGHPNGAAGCVLIGVPLLIGVIQEGRAPRWSIVVALVLMGGVFYLTKSRGPLIVSAALVAYWFWSQTRGVRVPLMLAGVMAVLGVLSVLAAGGLGAGGDGILLERFLDLNSISVNAGDRWWTIATSLDLLLGNPLGMGSGYVEPLDRATGTTATHNAYLELALMGGAPLMVLVVVRLIKAAAGLFTSWQPVEAWLAAYLLGIFCFESYFLQIGIQLTTLWLVISPSRSFERQTLHQAALWRPPLSDQHLAARGATRDLPR